MTGDDPRLWGERAACHGVNPSVMFPIGDLRRNPHLVHQAKQICAGCQVKAECLAWAIDNHEDYGIWGGMTASARRRSQENPSLGRPSAPLRHRTEGGYRAHLRRGETACDACLQAHRERQYAWKDQVTG